MRELKGVFEQAREIYTRVSNKNVGKIKSPLDSLFEKESGGGANKR